MSSFEFLMESPRRTRPQTWPESRKTSNLSPMANSAPLRFSRAFEASTVISIIASDRRVYTSIS